MKTEWPKAVREGEFQLPVCLACSTVQYPIREVCVNCLSDELEWQRTNNTGEVLATTVQHYTLDEKFKPQLPLYVASVKLDSGPVVIVFTDVDVKAGDRVSVINRKNEMDELTLFAEAANGEYC